MRPIGHEDLVRGGAEQSSHPVIRLIEGGMRTLDSGLTPCSSFLQIGGPTTSQGETSAWPIGNALSSAACGQRSETELLSLRQASSRLHNIGLAQRCPIVALEKEVLRIKKSVSSGLRSRAPGLDLG